MVIFVAYVFRMVLKAGICSGATYNCLDPNLNSTIILFDTVNVSSLYRDISHNLFNGW